jgi:hypothetical protein
LSKGERRAWASIRRGPPGGGVEVGGLAPALYGDGNEGPVLNELGQPRLGAVDRHAEVVAQVLGRRHAHGARRDPVERALSLVARRRGCFDDGPRQHLFRQAIDPFEGSAPGGRGELTGPEQAFDRAFGLAPAPPAAFALVAHVEFRGGHRAARGDLLQHLVYEVAPLTQEAGDALPDARAIVGVLHPPAEQRLTRQGQEGSLVRPVFEYRPLPAPGYLIEQRARIGAEPREGRQVVGARDHVDAVDLHHAQPLDQPEELALADLAIGPRRAETLGGERDTTGLAGGEGSSLQGPVIPR